MRWEAKCHGDTTAVAAPTIQVYRPCHAMAPGIEEEAAVPLASLLSPQPLPMERECGVELGIVRGAHLQQDGKKECRSEENSLHRGRKCFFQFTPLTSSLLQISRPATH